MLANGMGQILVSERTGGPWEDVHTGMGQMLVNGRMGGPWGIQFVHWNGFPNG